MTQIERYFPDLHIDTIKKLSQLHDLLIYWNERINVISRKDIDHLYERHILHGLTIAHYISFAPHTNILDVGTGGGIPGIPLAIMFPEVNFHLVDSIGKKIMVVKEITKELNLQNVEADQVRCETLPKSKYDFIASRAVINLPQFYKLTHKLINHKNQFNSLNNGILYLKGGDFTDELEQLPWKYNEYNLIEYFCLPFFETKKLLHIFP